MQVFHHMHTVRKAVYMRRPPFLTTAAAAPAAAAANAGGHNVMYVTRGSGRRFARTLTGNSNAEIISKLIAKVLP